MFAVALLLIGGIVFIKLCYMMSSSRGPSVKIVNATNAEARFEFKYTDFDAVSTSTYPPANWPLVVTPKSTHPLMGVGNAQGPYPVSIYVFSDGKQWEIPCSSGNIYFVVSLSPERPAGSCIGSDSNFYRLWDNPEIILGELKHHFNNLISRQ